MSETPDAPRFVDQARRYQLGDRIATGGMGEVWRAQDTVLNRAVAVKLLKPEYADDASFRARFESEARNAAALHHPNVAAVFDFGEADAADGSGTPRPYLIMELVDGKPLSDLIRHGNPMDPVPMRELLAQAADAIGAAHAAGIVHRDVKPANLLVTPDRRVKITDFGIARAAEGMALTQTGQVMGTPQYLSPEQAQGKGASPASDVYSLGVVAYECLAGHRPFEADSPVATALAHVREPVPDLPDDIPADLAAVVYKTMEKNPEDRFPDGRELAAALRDPATAATMIAGAGGPGDRTSVLPGAAAGAGLGAAAGAAAGYAAGRGSGGSDTQGFDQQSGTPADGTRVMGPGGPAGAGAAGAGAAGAAGGAAARRTTSDTSRGGRRNLTWLWVLLAVAAVVIAVVLLMQLGGDDEPTQAEPTPTPTQTEEPTPTEEPTQDEPETVTISEGDYVGRDVDDASADLRQLGLRVRRNEVSNPGDEDEDEVTSVNPTGTVEKGSTITLDYYGPQPEEEPEPEEPEEPEPTSPGTTAPTQESPSDTGSPSSEESTDSASPSVSRASDSQDAGDGSESGRGSGEPSESTESSQQSGGSGASTGSAMRPVSRGDR